MKKTTLFQRFPRRGSAALVSTFSVGLLLAPVGLAQTDLCIYADALGSGWNNYPMAAVDYRNPSPVHAGTQSIRVSADAGQGLVFYRGGFDVEPYSDLAFWIHGGATGGQLLQVLAIANGSPQTPVALAPLVAGQWQLMILPLAALGIAAHPNVSAFAILDRSGLAQPTFYVDDIRLIALPPPVVPAVVRVSVEATQPVRRADARLFGINAAIWDGEFDTPATLSLLRQVQIQALRFPGGSLSDEYHWAANRTGTNTWAWVTSFDRFAHTTTNLGAQVFITANYGTGSATEAADWVRYSNITRHYGFGYWEIGNENYGPWEADAQACPHDPYTYATRAKDYYRRMKAVDPTIKIGIVVLPGEDASFVSYTNHPVVNPRTGQIHCGWTPVVLATLKNLGITPDFLIHHKYAQDPGMESDAVLLQSTHSWTNDAADLRQQLTDYLGSAGARVELVCTEHNSVSSGCGKQTTSLANGLFLADSLGQALQTEFASLLWWDLRNGPDSANNNDPTLYGWRTYGDYGLVREATNAYPTYYVTKLLKYFVRGGDQIVRATSDFPLLSAYAAWRTNGTLTLLVVNKHPSAGLTAQVDFSGYAPCPEGLVYSYGITQDEAARTGQGSPDVAQSSFTNAAATIAYTFPPYSVTVLVISSSLSPPQLAAPRTRAGAFQCQFQIRGLPGQRVLVQASSDLKEWLPLSTNTLSGTQWDFSECFARQPERRFYRAVVLR